MSHHLLHRFAVNSERNMFAFFRSFQNTQKEAIEPQIIKHSSRVSIYLIESKKNEWILQSFSSEYSTRTDYRRIHTLTYFLRLLKLITVSLCHSTIQNPLSGLSQIILRATQTHVKDLEREWASGKSSKNSFRWNRSATKRKFERKRQWKNTRQTKTCSFVREKIYCGLSHSP